MLNKWRTLFTGLLFVGLLAPLSAQDITLSIGNVTVPPESVNTASCIQVPIFLTDDMANRDIRDLTFTVEISGDTGIINGGIATEMIVANSFVQAGTGTGATGIANPGIDLVNNNGNTGASCGQVFNQATEGQGPTADFPASVNNFANWNINNNQGNVGRKQGFLIDLVGNANVGGFAAGTPTLIAVLEIPVIANPGTSQLLVTATPTGMVAGGNTYSWDNGVRDTNGELVIVSNDFLLPAEPSTVNIFNPVDCTAASDNGPLTWTDPQVGGTGATVNMTFPGTTNADRININGDGVDVDVASGGATTNASLNTDADGSPNPDTADPSYTITYEVEFPPASGTYVGGTTCTLTPGWAATTADQEWTVTPINGGDTTMTITLTNARWDGSKFGNLTGPDGVDVDLVTPDALGGGSNVLVFTDILSLTNLDNTNVGDYIVTGIGPGANTYSNTLTLSLEPPVNETNCNLISVADIEGDVTIPLAGNVGTIDFTVVYNGTTYDNLPEGDFVLPNISADATTVLIQANGFDGPTPTSDDITCTLDFAAPTCVATQDPAGTVDVGTVITLFLDTTNAVAASIDGVDMTPDVDPDNNFNVQWTATHVAIADTTLTATVTNADGDTTTCTWIIDINCIDPTIVDVAPVGETGITIFGTFGCDYTVRITQHNTGTVTDYDVTIDTLTDAVLNVGTGTLNVTIPSDAWIEVGQLGFPSATDMVPTVPTLGQWGMIAFITLLMGAGMVMMRRRQTA